ncbi:PAS domain S-box protein [Fischerella sp. PCC 9605]|uniref:PAS domain S-box protein n=1 Tax=Fischerella sp. PCC 9605 TaxID=1173024 RepID=UPI0004B839B1|nr:PAS domain S-box protein [Fischerella sp. PCC 9605]
MALRFLLLEDNPLDADVIKATLLDGGIDCELLIVKTRSNFVTALENDVFDLILADYALPEFDGLAALEIARNLCSEAPFIFVTASLGEELAIETLKRGATDYVLKQRLGRLVPSVQRALRETQERRKRKRAELMLVEQKRLLLLIASGHPLSECLTATCASVSGLNPGTRACFLLSDAQRRTFKSSITPDFPPSFGQGLKDAPINDLCIGTCGEAVYRGEPITCADIANDDRWSIEWRNLCVTHGILACHSQPVIGVDGLPLGSLMLCFDQARMPTDWEYQLADFATQVASIVFERDRSNFALRESEAKYRKLFESIDEGFCICEMLFDENGEPTDYRFVEVNPVFERLTGLQQATGKTARELVPNLEDHWFEIYGRVVLTGEPIRFEDQSFAMNNRWFDVNAFCVDDPQSHKFAILFTNISDRKQVERERERFLAVGSDLQVIAGINGYFQWVSQTFERTLGWTSDEITSRPWTDFVHPDDISASVSQANSLFLGNETSAFENRYRHKDGSYRWLLWKAQAYLEEQVIYGVAVDITDRKIAEAALRESEEQLRLASLGANLGMWYWDVKTDTLTWTDQAKAIFGLPTDTEMSMQVFLSAVHPDDRQFVETVVSELQAGQMYTEIEYRTLWADGTVRWILARGDSAYNTDGTLIATRGVLMDITDRKIAEAERKQLNQQLTDRVNELQTLFNLLPIGVAIAEDSECRMIRANPHMSELIRVPVEVNASHSAPTDERPLYRLCREGQEIPVEALPMQYAAIHNTAVRDEVIDLVHPDGTMVKLLCYASPLLDGQGRVRGALGAFVDITQRVLDEATLRESEERLKIALATGKLGSWQLDLVTGVLDSSDRCKANFGLSPEAELSYERLFELIHPDDRLYVQKTVAIAIAQRIDYNAEYRTIWLDGSVHWIIARGRALYDANGQPLRMIGVTLDITDRKQTEEALRQSEEQLRLACEGANLGLWHWDVQSDTLTWTDQCKALFGLPRDTEMSYQVFLDTLHPEDRQRIHEMRPLLESGQLVRHEIEYRTVWPDGTVHWIAARGNATYDADGKPISSMGVAFDISDRKFAEIALSQSEARFRRTFECNMVPMGIWTRSGGILQANDALLDLVGYTRQELEAGQINWQTITPPEWLPLDERSLAEIATRGLSAPFEKEYIHKNGHRIPIFIGGASFLDDAESGIFFAIDLSDRKCRERNTEFLADISQDLTRSITINEIFESIGGKMCRYFDFSILMFSEINDTAQEARVIYNNHNPDVKDALGEHRLADYLSDSQIEQLKAGKVVAINDVGALDIEGGDGAYQPFQVRSTLIAPYVSNGQLKFIFSGNRNTTSRWRQDEIELVQELAARIWIRIERARAEENLRRSEEEFRTIANAAPALVWVSSPSGEIIFFNDRWYEFTGQTEAQAVGYGWAQTMHPEDAARILPYWERCQQTGETYEGEVRYRRHDGEYRWHAFRALPRCDPNGQIEAWYGLSIDISDRKIAEAALRESERRFRRLVESNMFGVAFGGFTGSFHYVNDYFLKMVGYTRESIETGQVRWMDITPTEFLPLDEKAAVELRTKGVATPFEKEYIRKDGTRVPILIGAALLQEPYEQQQEIIAFYLDLTERKQAEAALREREQRLNLATSAAKLGVFEWNVEADVAIWENPQMYEIFGHTPEDGTLNKVQFMDVIHPEDREAFELCLVEGMRSNTLFHAICRIRRRNDSQWRWVEFNGQFERVLDGTPVRLVGVLADISDRKQVEAEREQLLQQLEASLGQLEAVINSMTEGLVIADPQGNILTFNPAALAMHGYDSVEQVRRHLNSFPGTIEVHDLQGNFIPMEQWPISRALQGETFSNCEIQIHRRDTGKIWFGNYGGTPVRDKQGQVILAMVTIRDVTEQRQAQAAIARSLAAEQAARAEAETANRIKDEFLAVLSHELRSPLNPILGWAKLLQSRTFTPDKTAQALATIERNAKLQAQLIEDLLDVSRILRGKMVLDIGPVNLVTTIEAAIETVRLAAENKSIQIQTRLDAHVGTVSGDSARLQQIIWNLLTNAVKFTPQGGQVEVRLDRVNSFAQIQVKDTGKGISPEFLPYVFDYFRQEDGAITRKFGGLGLGLAIVRHLTEQHGGTIQVDSPGEGLGATFTLRLPLPTLISKTVQEHSFGTETFDLSQLKILVVDDEADMRELMLTLLEAYGAQVSVAASAPEALLILEQNQPDLLISDIGMPEMDGYMLMQQVRSLPPHQGGQIKAIALTAYAGELDQRQALTVGFHKHIPKPVEPETLIRAIADLVQQVGG